MVIFTTLIIIFQLIFVPMAYSAAIEGKDEGSRVAYCKSIDFVGGSQVLTATGLDCTLTSTAGDGGGDVSGVGDCTGGDCLDGSADGGTWIKFYDAQGAGQLILDDLTDARVWTFPDKTGTVAMTSDIGATAYDDIGDPDAAGSISFDDNETATYTTAEDTGTFFTLANTDADLSGATYMLDITYVDDGSAYGYYIRGRDDTGGTPNTVFSIGGDGAINTDAGVTALGTIEGATITEGGIAVLNNDEMDSSAELLNIFDDETGTGVIVFGTSPTFTTSILAASQADIGSTSAEFGDIFIGDGKAIKFGDDQDVTLTHVADTGIQMELDDKIMFGDTAVYIHSDDDGYLDIEADTGIRLLGPTALGDNTLSATGAVTLQDAEVEVPNGTADKALATAGEIHLNTTDEQLSFHSAADGEISGEAAISLLRHLVASFDPGSWYDSDGELFLMKVGDDAPEGITIVEWALSCNVDPDVELALDLKYADAWIGLANAAVIDVLDTTNGVSSEDTNASINSGNAVANGKVVYLSFDSDPEGTCVQATFEMWFYNEED